MLFYNVLIFFYHKAIFFASIFNPKAKKWIAGRKHLLKHIENTVDPNSKHEG